jgi:proteic killer suppression protein
MIRSYGDDDVKAFRSGVRIRRWIQIERIHVRKLAALDDARSLDDLRNPPANRLKPLRGDRTGQFSIRVNDQYRVCFVWRHGHAYEVTVVDYH